jgi:16S rRNA (uracil1498-N3)-methyltransferase
LLEKKKIVLSQIDKIKFQQPEKINIRLIMPYIKKENLFFAIQKVTEIGISNISLFRPDNIDQSIKKKDLSKINEKALSIIAQACEQSGSNIVPDFETYEDISSAVIQDKFTIFFDLDATNDFKSIKNYDDNITLITGPESGFSKKERESLDVIANYNISLGKNVLRAETSPITALSVIKSNLGLL